jgi:uncharacterized protein (DUF111 family)
MTQSPASKDVSMEVEEYPLREAVTKKQICEHKAEWEDLENAVVICRSHRIAKVL